ncbi:hypothetical protein KW823_10095 [Enterobacter quasiroggenkampii]|nr:hypothetical protein [Enterobacter quasiroggenkampii]
MKWFITGFGVSMLFACTAATAATMSITAEFSPSMDNPGNYKFINTTPQGGFCVTWSQLCTGGQVSISLPFSMATTKAIQANAPKREGYFVKLPSAWRSVQVTNVDTGKTVSVNFRASRYSGRLSIPNDNRWGSAGDGSLAYPENSGSGGCSSGAGGTGLVGSSTWQEHAWNYGVTADAGGCYRISAKGYPSISWSRLSIGYVLETPNPLAMDSGLYTGSHTFSIGPGGDFDFGDNITASDTSLTVNFSLSVNHELKLSSTTNSVSLQPCARGKICSEEQGKANWERWMVNRITPELTGRSTFNLSSSGEFTVYLECEQRLGSDCALRSNTNPGQLVAVQSLLTLPDNIADKSTGADVIKKRLTAGRDLSSIFTTKTYGEARSGSVDFLVTQKDVDTMLKTRPDTYSGAITVIFDPQIH